jgi:hypothetical protein
MLPIATMVPLAFSIVCKPPYPAANDAFSIFESCKEVKEVRLCDEQDASLYSVRAVLVLTDDTRLHARGAALQRHRAYHVASASALYALDRHRRRHEPEA